MTWRQACQKSPHRMAIRCCRAQRMYKYVLTEHGDVFTREVAGGQFIPRGLLGVFGGGFLVGLDDWEPLTGEDVKA